MVEDNFPRFVTISQMLVLRMVLWRRPMQNAAISEKENGNDPRQHLAYSYEYIYGRHFTCWSHTLCYSRVRQNISGTPLDIPLSPHHARSF